MRDKRQTYDATFGEWRRILKPFLDQTEEIPHLGGHVTRLTSLLARVDEVEGRQAAFAAAKQEASQKLKALVVEGRKIAAFIKAGLRDHHGRGSEKLTEYGLQPFRGNKSATLEEPIEIEQPALSTTTPTD